MENEREYREKLIRSFNWRYTKGQDAWSRDPGLRATAVRLQERLGGPGHRVLDIGIGVGNPARVLLEAGQHVTGVDLFAPDAWDELRAEWPGRIDLIQSDFNQWQAPEQPFDAALDNGCLHHQHPSLFEAYLRKVWRLLVPGGHFLLNIYAEMDEARSEGRITYTDNERICKYFRPDEVDALLVAADFRVTGREYLYREGLDEYYMLVTATTPERG